MMENRDEVRIELKESVENALGFAEEYGNRFVINLLQKALDQLTEENA